MAPDNIVCSFAQALIFLVLEIVKMIVKYVMIVK